ncbi:MAG: hypothetical protein R6X02_17865 [Enhygromyxa sp.]
MSSLYRKGVRSAIESELETRLDALARRVETSLTNVREGRVSSPRLQSGEHHAEALRAAEAGAQLQAQRCRALEEQLATLESALADERAAREQAEANAESAREQLVQFEDSGREPEGAALDLKIAETLQAKLLEVERLTSELAELRRSNEEWRSRARSNRRELDSVAAKLERASTQCNELRAREEAASRRVAELERVVAEQRRELELAERRAKHLREHMSAR